MKRTGQLTVPNLIAVTVLLFIFSVFSEPIMETIQIILEREGNPLTTAIMVTLPAIFLITIASLPFIKAEQKKIKQRQTRRTNRR